MNYICLKLVNDISHIVFSYELDSNPEDKISLPPLPHQCSKNYRMLAPIDVEYNSILYLKVH